MSLKPLLLEDATDFERLLLGSAELDVPPAGAATALLDRLGGAPVVSFAEERRKRSVATWVFFIAAALGVALVVFDRTRHRDHVAITHESVSVPTPTPTNDPAPVPVAAPQPASEPSASASVSPPAPPPPPSARKGIVRLPASASVQRPAAASPPGTPFDKGAAARALALIDYQSCATADGPTGPGHVTVTFDNDGTVSVARVDDSTFPGTAVGGCIAGKFRAAQVPPFDGSSVRVGKSFTVK